LGISGLDPRILAFSTPENAPAEISLGLKKSWGKKKGHRNHPKKKVLAPKKKVGVEQEKVTQVILGSWLPCHGPAQDRRTRIGFTAVTVAQSKE
jgi:hypothetical protein